MDNVRKISARRFTYELHCSSQRQSIFTLWDFDRHVPHPCWKMVGYCDAANIAGFSTDGRRYGVMLERTAPDPIWMYGDVGEEIWLHVNYLSKDEEDRYCEAEYIENGQLDGGVAQSGEQ